MNRRKKDSTVREDRHGRGPGVRIADRLTITAFACAATIALAIVAFANAGQVGAVTRWTGDSDFGAPYPTEVAHPADPGPESATASLANGVLLPEGCGSVASTAGLGESTYATPPLDHECAESVTVEKRDHFGCFLNWFGDSRRCMFDLTCDLEEVCQLSESTTVSYEGFEYERTVTQDMCGYGKCGDFNVAGVPR